MLLSILLLLLDFPSSTSSFPSSRLLLVANLHARFWGGILVLMMMKIRRMIREERMAENDEGEYRLGFGGGCRRRDRCGGDRRWQLGRDKGRGISFSA